MKTITLKSPLDMHLHLRDNEILEKVAPLSALTFAWAVIMPNLVAPVKTKIDVINYKNRILKSIWSEKFNPYMTVFFHEELTRKDLEEFKKHILSIKLYPAWITTNSEGWAKNLLSDKSLEIFWIMEELWIILNIHGETNDFVMDREKNFVAIYESLAQRFPKLKIVMEHITTQVSAELVQKYDNLYATITLHHLYITLDDVAWGTLEPHLFCKPIAKRPEDRKALLELALSWNKKVMFGSDSAPHTQSAKECSHCSAWVFTAPIAIQLLVQLFEQNNSLENIEKFLSLNAIDIYNLDKWIENINNLIEKEVTIEKKDFIIPDKYDNVVPFMAWETIEWSVK